MLPGAPTRTGYPCVAMLVSYPRHIITDIVEKAINVEWNKCSLYKPSGILTGITTQAPSAQEPLKSEGGECE